VHLRSFEATWRSARAPSRPPAVRSALIMINARRSAIGMSRSPHSTIFRLTCGTMLSSSGFKLASHVDSTCRRNCRLRNSIGARPPGRCCGQKWTRTVYGPSRRATPAFPLVDARSTPRTRQLCPSANGDPLWPAAANAIFHPALASVVVAAALEGRAIAPDAHPQACRVIPPDRRRRRGGTRAPRRAGCADPGRG
jgi:hypothetical protein